MDGQTIAVVRYGMISGENASGQVKVSLEGTEMRVSYKAAVGIFQE